MIGNHEWGGPPCMMCSMPLNDAIAGCAARARASRPGRSCSCAGGRSCRCGMSARRRGPGRRCRTPTTRYGRWCAQPMASSAGRVSLSPPAAHRARPIRDDEDLHGRLAVVIVHGRPLYGSTDDGLRSGHRKSYELPTQSHPRVAYSAHPCAELHDAILLIEIAIRTLRIPRHVRLGSFLDVQARRP
jgi:hypothetical protein